MSSSDHCMVNFIKENLLGSVKEFRNRFINPIQNGQCADSTLHDVRIMKKRAHILYEMLAGCVQVRDSQPTDSASARPFSFSPLRITFCSFSRSEKRLLGAHQVPASQIRVCAVDQNNPAPVQTLQTLPGALHR